MMMGAERNGRSCRHHRLGSRSELQMLTSSQKLTTASFQFHGSTTTAITIFEVRFYRSLTSKKKRPPYSLIFLFCFVLNTLPKISICEGICVIKKLILGGN
jgi:hypothetical protein